MSSPESLQLLKILNTTSSVFNTYGASGALLLQVKCQSSEGQASDGSFDELGTTEQHVISAA